MLKFENVSVSANHTPILENISFNVKPGTITAIVGPNGCGKTTLLQTLNGASTITSGNVIINGTNIKNLSSRDRAKAVALLPQVRTIIPSLPVKTLVEHGRFPYLGFSRKKNEADKEIVKKVMEFTGIAEYADQYVDTLSGGLRQRAFFAMTLAQDSDLIVLDEPTTYLDIEGQRNMLNLIKDLKNHGKTICLVLHDLNQALCISDNIIVMNDKKIVFDGTPSECVSNHILDTVFHASCKEFTDEDGKYYFFA